MYIYTYKYLCIYLYIHLFVYLFVYLFFILAVRQLHQLHRQPDLAYPDPRGPELLRLQGHVEEPGVNVKLFFLCL